MRHLSTFRLRTLVGRASFIAALVVVFVVLFGFGDVVFAQGDFGVAAVDSRIALSGRSIVLIIVQVIRILLGLLGLVLVIMIIYAGYTIMTSAGNEEKVAQGKTILKNAVIGTAIVLFSLIIVQFVISILKEATGLTPRTAQPPGIETFAGIGSLGQEPQSHYPMPAQTDVYRNTKIVVTFTDRIDPSSIILNSNNTCWGPGNAPTSTCGVDAVPYYGDCLDGLCDTLVTSTIAINKLNEKEATPVEDRIEADALVAYENGSDARTFVFKPRVLLGNEETDQWHSVLITNAVKNTKGEGLFEALFESGYTWQFETNTDVDLVPPYVVDVSPNPGETIEKNIMLKVTFNEAVDPMAVQGMLGPDSSFSNVVVAMHNESIVSPGLSQIDTEYIADFKGAVRYYDDTVVDIIYEGGQYAYIAYFDGTISKIDVTVPEKPVDVVDGVYTPAAAEATRKHTIQHGTFLYAVRGGTGGTDGRLHIIDTETMREIGVLSGLHNPQEVAVYGEYAYIADLDEGIKIVRISDPSNMSIVGSMGVDMQQVKEIAVDGTVLYFGGKGGIQFGIVDLSTSPENPTKVGQVLLTKTPTDIVVHNGRAYVGVGSNGIRIIDVSNMPQSLDTIHQVHPGSTGPDGNIVFSLDIQGDVLVVGQQRAFQLFSLEDSLDEPTPLVSYPQDVVGALGIDNFRPVSLIDDYLYMGQQNDGLQVYRVVAGAPDSFDKPGIPSNSPESIPVAGQWKITNGYRTVEFLSSLPCGDNAINSCGDPLYCLPTLCEEYDRTCTAEYSVLARTASVKDGDEGSFVASGLVDGVVDMADNALDSAPDIDETGSVIPGSHDFPEPHNKPDFVGTKKDIDLEERFSDNYWWNFTVINDIDSTSPYIHTVDPGIDQQGVSEFKSVDVFFSKEMLLGSLTGVSLHEYPQTNVGLGYMHLAEDKEAFESVNGGAAKSLTKTLLHVEHPVRPFGPGDTDYWYFANVSSTVQAMNQFCLYPGRGPYATSPQKGEEPFCSVTYDEDWNILAGGVDDTCRPIEPQTTSSTDTGCISTGTIVPHTMGDTETCIQALSDDTVSPSNFIQTF